MTHRRTLAGARQARSHMVSQTARKTVGIYSGREGNFTTFVTQRPTLQQISSSTDMTRTSDPCHCGHDRRFHGPTRCHWLDCACVTFDAGQVRR